MAAAGEFPIGPTKHGLGVLWALAGPYLNALCPKLTRTKTSPFAARVGYKGVPNSSDLQWIRWITSESTVKNTFFCLGSNPHPITLSTLPHSAFSDSNASFIPERKEKLVF